MSQFTHTIMLHCNTQHLPCAVSTQFFALCFGVITSATSLMDCTQFYLEGNTKFAMSMGGKHLKIYEVQRRRE